MTRRACRDKPFPHMKRRSNDSTQLIPPAREILRDPAVWAWIAVALLAILPARAVLAGS